MRIDLNIGILAAAAVFLPAVASAGVIVANGGPATAGLSLNNSLAIHAANFMSPSMPAAIASVDLPFIQFTGIGNTTLRLFSAGVGSPGSSIASFGSQSVSASGTFSFTPLAPVQIMASTSYWLVLDCGNCYVTADEVGWGVRDGVATTGLPGATAMPGLTTSLTGGATWITFNSGQAFVYQVNGTVPEPSTAILLGLGLGAAWFVRRRAR